MFIRGYTVGPVSTNCFILGDEETKLAAVIDPGDRGALLAKKVEENGYTPVMILLTHGHFDHIGGVKELQSTWKATHGGEDIPVYIHKADYPDAPASFMRGITLEGVPNVRHYDEGDTLQVGGMTVEVLATPGHTKGGVTLKAEDALFTGDTLFCGSCGRTDFETSDVKEMYASLKKLGMLSGNYQVFPGHDRPTTLDAEREENPYLMYACRNSLTPFFSNTEVYSLKPLKILVISYYDDNFGDMLIKICFCNLLRTVLENLGISRDRYSIQCMGLRQYQTELVEESNLICFAGGGLFGLSYLHFNEGMSAILDIAEQKDIPVLFSSMGINHIDSSEESQSYLTQVLQHRCIKAMSVRENLELFQACFPHSAVPVCQVCDPVVWGREVYTKELASVFRQKSQEHTPVIGINVVRGGLFKDNGGQWGMTAELDYLYQLKTIAEERGFDYRFYTNGSTLDNNQMLALAKTRDIPMSKLVFVDSSSELVQTIAGFDAVAAIRMHSSILSYSLDVPVVNLVWNEKIPFFYQAIGYPMGALSQEEWDAETVFDRLMSISEVKKANQPQHDAHKQQYMMSLYTYLYQSLSGILECSNSAPIYPFEQVCASVCLPDSTVSDDFFDMKFKLYEGERRYFNVFMKERDAQAQLKRMEKEISAAKTQLAKETASLEKANAGLTDTKAKLAATKEKLAATKEKLTAEKEKRIAAEQSLKSTQAKLQKTEATLTANKAQLKEKQETIRQLTKRLNRIERNPFFRAGQGGYRFLRKLKRLIVHK